MKFFTSHGLSLEQILCFLAPLGPAKEMCHVRVDIKLYQGMLMRKWPCSTTTSYQKNLPRKANFRCFFVLSSTLNATSPSVLTKAAPKFHEQVFMHKHPNLQQNHPHQCEKLPPFSSPAPRLFGQRRAVSNFGHIKKRRMN